tara:strand:+ start:1497 stop:2507 length:1011 start_codon:yes stop_codon:yes gene_type:complete
MNKLLDCLINKNPAKVPIWFMRQAGRYLPEFRKIRSQNPNFINLCLNSDLVTEITLQPIKRFNLDGTIIFSDILMIPYGLGQKVEFKKGIGPILYDFNIDEIVNIKSADFTKKLSPVYKAIGQVKNQVNNTNLIGFVGAPWTLIVYMLMKQSPKNNFNIKDIVNQKEIIRKLMDKIKETIILHVENQIKAGAEIIQIFDSWAGLLQQEHLSEYCYSPTADIVAHIKSKKVPVICFPRGIKKSYLDFCKTVSPDCINIDYEIDPNWIEENIKNISIQGGMDPKILLTDKKNIEENVKFFLKTFSKHSYIFNLGHGVLPETKPEAIEEVIKTVQRYNK